MNSSLIEKVLAVAESSPSKQKVGALVLRKGKIVASACNSDRKTHPKQAKWAERAGLHPKQYLHAEVAALVRCRCDVDTIVVARVNRQHQLRNARPCPICQLAIQEAGIKNVYYSTDQGFLYEYPVLRS